MGQWRGYLWSMGALSGHIVGYDRFTNTVVNEKLPWVDKRGGIRTLSDVSPPPHRRLATKSNNVHYPNLLRHFLETGQIAVVLDGISRMEKA